MTAARFKILKLFPEQIQDHERAEFERTLAWERRSAAARKAVETKRRKYKRWPTSRGDHK